MSLNEGNLRYHRVCSTKTCSWSRWWPKRRRLGYAKHSQTRGLIAHYFRVRKSSYRPITSCPDPSSTTVYSYSGSYLVYKECNHLYHEGLRHKELYYNVFEKNHAAGPSGFGSVNMREASNSYVEVELSMDNSKTQSVLGGDPTPTNNRWQGIHHRVGNETGPSQSRGSSGKRKQREATNEMTYSAIHEIVSHFRGRSQTGTSNEQSSRLNHLLTCMNTLTGMGILLNNQTIMWHYFKAHPRVQRTFLHLSNEDQLDIIAFVVKSQSPQDH